MKKAVAKTAPQKAKKPAAKPIKALPKKAAVEKISESEASESNSDVRSVSESSGEENEANETELLNKGEFIALVDPEDVEDGFKIGEVIEDQDDVTADVIVNLFTQKGSSKTYELAESKVAVAEYCIICNVDVIIPKSKAGQAAHNSIQLTLQNFKQAEKLMPEIVSALDDIVSEGEEDEDEEPAENESEGEEDEDGDSSDDSEETISKRRTVSTTAKRNVTNKAGAPIKKAPAVVKQKAAAAMKVVDSRRGSLTRAGTVADKKSASVNAKKEIAPKKAKTTKVASRKISKQEEEDNEMEAEEGKSEDDFEMVDEDEVKPKRGAKAKQAPRKTSAQVGQKRQRAQSQKASKKGKNISESDEEEKGGSDENEEHSDEGFQVVKKRKVSKGKEKAVKQKKQPKAKKVKEPKQKRVAVPKGKKRPTEFKRGKWNPDMQVLDINKTKEDPSNQPINDCCIRCNSRNFIRAAVTGNKKLLQNCLDQHKQISMLTAYWSPEVQQTALEYMIKSNNHELLETFLHPKLSIPAHSTYDNERNVYYNKRVINPQYLLNFVDSGMVSQMAYGVKVRKVQMTRGNRQGNNAFLQYQDNPTSNPIQILNDGTFLRSLVNSPEVTTETFKILYKLHPSIKDTLNSIFHEVVKAGNRELAYDLIKDLVKQQNWGFNNLHMEVLGKQIDQAKILKVSVVKKAASNADITPLHCACINPNPAILKQLLDINNETDVPDQQQRRPVHYAAACVSPEPLKLLIEAGAMLTVLDNTRLNCLHIAAKLGRAENIRTILTANPAMLNSKTKEGMNAIAFASQNGHVEAVQVLASFKAKINMGVGAERMSPLCWAAAYGHYELAEMLLNTKGNALGKDKFGRTPLILAIRNGHSKLASLLLQHGAEWDSKDSSHNSALHYAAAYGWVECIELLLKAGANVNMQNSWKITPINIAMLKNHQGCVKRLLDEPEIDVNCKDEKGRTLLMLSLVKFDVDSKSFVRFLLKKGADPNIVDLEGQSALHYIAKQVIQRQQNVGYGFGGFGGFGGYNYNQPQLTAQEQKAEYESQIDIQIHVTNLLIEFNADLSIKNSQGKTPFTLCLENNNAPLLDLLKKKISLNTEPTIFFAFQNKIFNIQFQKILLEIIDNDPPTSDVMNVLDSQGLTPFLSYVQAFTQQYQILQQTLQQKINHLSFTNGSNPSNYKITNEQLFDPLADMTYAHSYNHVMTAEVQASILKKLFKDIITKPFLDLLKKLIRRGADPQAVVGKLQTVREEEEKQRKLAAELKANGPKKELEEEKVMKRQVGQNLLNGGINTFLNQSPFPQPSLFGGKLGGYLGGGVFPGSSIAPAQQNKDKPVREYSNIGLQNAIHLAVVRPLPELIDFLLELEIDIDHPDYDQETPFYLMSKCYSAGDQDKVEFLQRLIKLDVRIDFPNRKGRTPFLNYYENQTSDIAYQLLDLGANVNQMDNSGLFALKYDLIRRSMPGITALLDRGANINQIDNRGRNLLHHAINMSSATADATFETEQFLIDQGVELNLRDSRGRTPLHYAFVKMKNWSASDKIDPIETVSSMCGCKGLEIDVPDKWMKTPLHYASQRGSSCCSMYLIKLGASTESKDIYNNTPLGVALLYNHFDYGILLIQKDCKVTEPVYREDPAAIAKKWKEEKKLRKKLERQKLLGNGHLEEDVEMKDDNAPPKEKKKKKKKVSKAHRSLFKMDDPYGEEYDEEDDYGEEEVEEEEEDDDEDPDSSDEEDMSNASDKYRHDNVFNQQNAFGTQVFPTQAPQQPMWGGRGRRGRKAPRKQLASRYFGAPMTMPATKTMIKQPFRKTYVVPYQNYAVRQDEKEGCSLFKLAIRAGQQGLAYLMMTSGYDLMLCIQDAMDEKKFMLVITLLSKTADDRVVQQLNSKSQNLIHILSINSQGCQQDQLSRIFQALNKRGVDGSTKDKYQRTALHYAVLSGRKDLVQLILNETDKHKYDVNAQDEFEHTPLTLLMQGHKVKAAIGQAVQPAAAPVSTSLMSSQIFAAPTYPTGGLFPGATATGSLFGGPTGMNIAGLMAAIPQPKKSPFSRGFIPSMAKTAAWPAAQAATSSLLPAAGLDLEINDTIFDILIKNGADVNVVYPEETWVPAFKGAELANTKFGEGYSEKEPYKCTIILNLIRHSTQRATHDEFTFTYRPNMQKLISSGARLDIVDSDGRDSIMYSIIANDKENMEFLLNNHQHVNINTRCQDKLGKSAAHYVVNPLKYGSYENASMLRDLNSKKFDMELKDNNGRTPLSYALEQKSGILVKMFTQILKLKNADAKKNNLDRQSSIVKAADWPKVKVDYVADSELFMQIAKEKEQKESHEKKFKVPVDSTGNFEKSYEVYYSAFNASDEEDGKVRPWDHYMMKVDLKNGLYGDFVFYKMQLLYDRNRDLYVVFTRWGRIGETGMNQRTPFNNVEEAKEDYKKIFKSKSANTLDDIDNFAKIKNKYNIAKVNYVTTDFKDYLAPFDYTKCPKSMLEEDTYHLFEEISNVSMYQKAMTQLGVNVNALPISGIQKETLLEAKELLGQISEAVKECNEIRKEGIKANYDAMVAVQDKISDLSSAYYELIPQSHYANSIVPPMNNEALIKTQFDNLQSLTYIEEASKMLLGALFRQKEKNPIDYIFEALNMMVEPLDHESGEFEVLEEYIKNTGQNNLHGQKVANIFKIQREGEAEVMDNFSKDIKNHTLLFHGSQIFNFLGIMSKGMKIAPPEAPPTGHILGKGVYFGDMFEKSVQYSYRTYDAQDSQLMLMCEVALGQSKELYLPEFVDQLPPQFQSIKGMGARSPDPSKNVTLPNGVKVPFGKPIQNEHPNANNNALGGWGNNYYHWNFQHNEYVVFNTSQIRMRYLVQVKSIKQ